MDGESKARMRKLRLLSFTLSSAVTVAMLAFAGCSGDDDGGAAPEEAGAEASRPDVITPGDSALPIDDSGTCVDRCQAQHPTGGPKNGAIEQCWTEHCDVPCNGAQGDAGDGGKPAPDAGDAGTCQNEVNTGSDACNACTVKSCCMPWDGCFDDPDCVALNDCLNRCPP